MGNKQSKAKKNLSSQNKATSDHINVKERRNNIPANIFLSKRDVLTDHNMKQLLIRGYCTNLPKDIISLCNKYVSFNSNDYTKLEMIPRNDENELLLCERREYIFESLTLKKNTNVIVTTDEVRITVIKNFEMQRNCYIKCKHTKCRIVFLVHGNFRIHPYSSISCNNQGNIYIKCKSMTMKENSKIRVYRFGPGMIDNNGLIYILCDKVMDIRAQDIQIFGGSVKIKCNNFQFRNKSYITAMMGGIEIDCNILHCVDAPSYALYASFQAKGGTLIVKKNAVSNTYRPIATTGQ